MFKRLRRPTILTFWKSVNWVLKHKFDGTVLILSASLNILCTCCSINMSQFFDDCVDGAFIVLWSSIGSLRSMLFFLLRSLYQCSLARDRKVALTVFEGAANADPFTIVGFKKISSKRKEKQWRCSQGVTEIVCRTLAINWVFFTTLTLSKNLRNSTFYDCR